MMTTAPATDQPTFTITEEILVRAPLEKTFSSLIAQMGRLNQTPDGKPLPMILEPRVGARWYRDLGGDDGHFWGFVQSIKRPALLEIWGPLFISTAATSNLQYRLKETPEGSLISFRHTLCGPFPEEHRPQLCSGWTALHARVRSAAEAGEATNFFADYAAYAEFLIALPLFIVAERIVSRTTREAANLFLETGVVHADDVPLVDAAHREAA